MLSIKILTLGLLLIIISSTANAQKLDEFEKKAARSSESGNNSGSSESENNSTGAIIEGEFEPEDVETTLNILGAFIDVTGRLLFYFPEAEGNMYEIRYSPYPYAVGNSGVYTYFGDKDFSIKADLHYFQLNRKLTGIGIKTNISPHPFIDFQIDYTRLSEQVKNGYDHLEFLNLFFNINRIKSEPFSLWWGLGIKTLTGNSSHTAFGLNFGAELFPVQPVSFSLLYNLGFFEGATVDDFNININLHINRFKIFAGYHKYRAGDIDFPGISAGIGVYF